MKYDVVIVGAGPAGLSCADITASQGLSTLVLERKSAVGSKVCAGGITWNGLLTKVADISQKTFSKQYVFTRNQSVVVTEDRPIIATVNRRELGQHMMAKAVKSGAEILPGSRVVAINHKSVTIKSGHKKENTEISFGSLVGADGSTSTIRKHLALSTENYGIGINYQLPVQREKMEWHLDSQLFKSGYGWIFPHKDTTSIGAYAHARVITAKRLNNNLLVWGKKRGIDFSGEKPRAEIINFDYKGETFQDTYLAGDAAGLASGLTGEGIYPAIISGQYVGHKICDHLYQSNEYTRLLKNHRRHSKAVRLAGKNPALTFFLAELTCLALRLKLLNFTAAEMSR